MVFETVDGAKKCLEKNRREASEDFRAKVCGRSVWVCEVLEKRQVRGLTEASVGVLICVFSDYFSQDVAQNRKTTGQLTKDRRNLHLADVGRIDNNSGSVWAELSSKDQEKRLSSIREKAEKLKNPNYKVSTVRLSVRNLPRTVDEHKLRHMFASGNKSVLRQVKLVKDDDGHSKGF